MQQKLLKVISALLIATMLYVNSAVVISYAADTLLSSTELEKQKTSTNNENVDFNVYYDDNTHSKSININDVDTKLNINLNVKNAGYLKDITVDFSNSNFAITAEKDDDNIIQNVDEKKKTISFNQINAGSNITKAIKISAEKNESVNADMFSKDNNIKLTATYVNSNGKEVAISKTLVIHTGWNAKEDKATLNYETTKYIPYAVNGTNKIIVQGNITSYLKDGVLPIKNTSIEVTAPQINNEYPEKVSVIANTNAATNGDISGNLFTENNWNYDNTTGKIIINVNNEAKNGKISWKKDSKDVYIVTYVYSENAYNAVKDSIVRITYSANSKISLYNDGTGVTNLTAKTSGYDDQDKAIGDIIDFSTYMTRNLNKGYMYNNKVASTADKKETIYNVLYTANVSYAPAVDKIVIEQGVDGFYDSNETESSTTVGNKNYAYNKTVLVSVEEFNKILGQDGTIKIFKDNEQVNTITRATAMLSSDEVNVINKDTLSGSGYYVLYISDLNTNKIKIETSKPVSEGNITFYIEKAFAKNIDYSKNQIKNFKTLRSSATIKAFNEDTAISEKTVEPTYVCELEEPTLKANISSNKESLSTILENKDVEIKATLETDSIEDMLYTNPTVTIKLPSNIETINVKDEKLYFDDELEIKEAKLVNNSDGTKSIITTLNGTQTKYNNVAAKGATLSIVADITLNKLTPTTDTEIELTIKNEDGETANSSCKIAYVAPTGVVTTNSIANYKENAEELMSISGEEKEAIIPTLSNSRNTTFTMNVINNYNYDLSNVVVLGRIPFENNKDILTNQSLGSNITLSLVEKLAIKNIDSSNATIYYSENGEANKDIQNKQNGWTTNPENLTNIKSYMIVLNNYTMKKGDSFTFSYKSQIPGNLEHNKSAYENYVVYYDSNESTENKTVAPKIGVTTGNGPSISANLSSTQGEKIQGGDILKYKLTVENNGTESAKGLQATIPVESSFTYVIKNDENINGYEIGSGIENKIDDNGNTICVLTIDLDEVKPHSSIEKEIWLLTDATSSNEIEYTAKVAVSNGDVAAKTNSITKIISKTYFKTSLTNENTEVQVGKEFSFNIYVQSSEPNLYIEDGKYQYTGNRNNSVISFDLPQECSITQVSKDDEDITNTVNNKNDKVSIPVGTVTNETVKVKVTLKANDLKDTYQKNVTIAPEIIADEMSSSEKIEETNIEINKIGVDVKLTSSIPSNTKIKTGEEFAYTISISNKSNTELLDVEIKDQLPKELVYSGMEMKVDAGVISESGCVDENNIFTTTLGLLDKKATATLTIRVVASKQDSDTKISNKAVVSQSELGNIESNSIENTIKAYNSDDEDIIVPGEETRKITGSVWYDENQNGIKDSDEKMVSDVKVLLLNNLTGDVAKDSNSEDLITKTDNNGEYAFSNVKQGKYTVIFFYDSANYSATAYKKDGADETKNSDAIDKDVTYEGETKKAGVSEEISLQNENIYNIDLGLIADKKFDLKLEKTISKITLNNNKQSKVYEYNKNLAKIDIASKDADNTTMIVEYKIKITNEGAIPGYVKKIADYIPESLKFNSELNKDWYTAKENNTIYNSSLSNTLINPGESKEVILTLTVKVTDNTFGMITNNAEIYEASNDYGLADTDSTPGNKKTDEDDYSTANILLGVKTGQIFIYVTLTITSIAIIGIGIYMIKKKVLK